MQLETPLRYLEVSLESFSVTPFGSVKFSRVDEMHLPSNSGETIGARWCESTVCVLQVGSQLPPRRRRRRRKSYYLNETR